MARACQHVVQCIAQWHSRVLAAMHEVTGEAGYDPQREVDKRRQCDWAGSVFPECGLQITQLLINHGPMWYMDTHDHRSGSGFYENRPCCRSNHLSRFREEGGICEHCADAWTLSTVSHFMYVSFCSMLWLGSAPVEAGRPGTVPADSSCNIADCKSRSEDRREGCSETTHPLWTGYEPQCGK